MDVMWAPWRMEYILGEKSGECIFCSFQKFSEEDEKNFVLYRDKLCFVVMNKYPYNNGHLMVIPYRHMANLTELNQDELMEMMKLTQKVLEVFKVAMKPSGFNIGINLGKVAGAGVEDHVHLHVVPRWEGDTNFMPVIGSIRVMPQHIQDTYNILKEVWKKLG
jgi:ATP adenylyltransferase